MSTINPHWLTANEGRDYPISESASLIDDLGARLPSDVLCDMRLLFPNSICQYAYLGSLTVSPTIVTLTILGTSDVPDYPANAPAPTAVSTVLPLATLSLLKPIEPHRPVPLVAYRGRVAGWVVFGYGANSRTDVRCRFSTAAQSLIASKAAIAIRTNRVRTVSAVDDQVNRLFGFVRLRGSSPIEIVSGVRNVDGADRTVGIIRLKQEADSNVLETFAGPCGKRPESDNCARPPLETINGIQPNCSGQIDIRLSGDLRPYPVLDSTSGVVLATAVGLDATCNTYQTEPDGSGNLPNDYDNLCEE